MFDKFVGSAFLSVSKRASRRNSAAMLDALEAIATIAPKECDVSKIAIDLLRKLEWKGNNTLAIGPFVSPSDSLFGSDDDASDTDRWFLIFDVRRYFSEVVVWNASTPESTRASTQDKECPEGKIERSIRYAREGLSTQKVEKFFFEKALREEYEKKKLWKGNNRMLAAEFDPSRELGLREDRRVVRTFGAELYRNMYKTLVAMEEALDADVSDRELADQINKKNTNPRFLLHRNEPVVRAID